MKIKMDIRIRLYRTSRRLPGIMLGERPITHFSFGGFGWGMQILFEERMRSEQDRSGAQWRQQAKNATQATSKF